MHSPASMFVCSCIGMPSELPGTRGVMELMRGESSGAERDRHFHSNACASSVGSEIACKHTQDHEQFSPFMSFAADAGMSCVIVCLTCASLHQTQAA